MKRTNNY